MGQTFRIRILVLKTFKSKPIIITAADEIKIGTRALVSGRKTIIDDILLWCDDKELILVYLECVRDFF